MASLQELQQIIHDRVASIKFEKQPVELYEPINYILSLGGKRLRPALCLLACDLVGGAVEDCLDTAVGLEIFHNFTLLHDDIMDNAPIRRGKTTVHKKWNENAAILSGDTMMALSYEFIMRAPESCRSTVFSLFNKTAIEVCEGQQYDMNFESQQDVSIQDYLEMIRLKTAVLLAGSLQIGAVIGGGDEKTANNLYQFGVNIGLAFQLKDDLLDVFSDQQKFGKTTGGDIVANKKTFLYLKALDEAQETDKSRLINFFEQENSDSKLKIAQVKEIYEKLNIKSKTEELINYYYSEAMAALDEMDNQFFNKTELIKFAHQLQVREY